MSRRDRARRITAAFEAVAPAIGRAAGEINLRIERLIVDDLAPADRHRLGAAVERELWRLFDERGVPPDAASQDRTAIDAATWSGSTPAAHVGVVIARAVYDALGDPQSRRSGPGAERRE